MFKSKKSGIADGANLNININKLNSSQKKENIDEIFNKIISSEVVKQLNKNNHLNTNASTKKIGTKKSNYVTIFKKKFKIPENIGNNKINPSFYNLFKNDNYIKYAKKIKNIKSIDPCLKQIYYLKPPSDDKLKAIEMLEKEISVKKKKCSDLPNLDLDKNPSNQSKSRNEKNENKSVSILENMTYRSRNTITNMKTIKFNHLNSKEKNKANDKIYTIDTNECIANTVNSIVSDKLKEGNRSSRNITTIDTLRTEDGRISQRRFNSQCDKQIEYAQKNFISTLESRNLYNEKFDKTFKTTFGNKDLYQEKLLANDVITEYRNAGTFAFSEKNLGFFLKHKNKIFQNLFVKNEN